MTHLPGPSARAITLRAFSPPLTTFNLGGATSPVYLRSEKLERTYVRCYCLSNLTDAAAAFEAGDHDAGDGGFEAALGFGQGVIQLGAFFQFGFIEGCFVDNQLGRGATFGAEGFDLKGNLGRAADR